MIVTTTALEPTEVLFLYANGGVAGAREAFDQLESRLPSLRGRRFYGLCGPGDTYRAAVARRADDDPAAMRLLIGTVPGGRYARTRIRNWSMNVAVIGAAFHEMAAAHSEDRTRPGIEFYRSEKDLILLMPIR